MSDNLLKIRRRMNSIKETRKITHAMELVSSSKLTRRKKVLSNIEKYALEMDKIVNECLKSLEINFDDFPLLKNNDGDNSLYIVVTSDLGLCGGYNTNVIKFANEIILDNDDVLLIGNKGNHKFHNIELIDDDLKKLSFDEVRLLSEKIQDKYINGNYKKVSLISTHYKNALNFIPKETVLLPLKIESNNYFGYEAIFSPNKTEVLKELLPKLLTFKLYHKIAESLLSEESSRRNAMENATDNADELTKELNLLYNKARQGAITSEIIEVVSGRNEEE